MGGEDWREDNRANWDERTAVHLGPGSFYDLEPLRAGQGRLDAIVRAELGPVAGLRALHLQCHFGQDTLTLAQQGAAAVVGLDFSPLPSKRRGASPGNSACRTAPASSNPTSTTRPGRFRRPAASTWSS